jgi:phenylalanyl-tRNA synthetase alpha chain
MTERDPVDEFEAGLAEVESSYAEAFTSAPDEPTLRAVNARFAGPQGRLTSLMKLMRDVPGDRRREFGQRSNALKQAVQEAFDQALEALARADREAELAETPWDVTLPGRGVSPGRLHPITRVKHELLDIFGTLGFEEVAGPEIDFHENNFDKLGFPPDHPATDMQDSFFVRGEDGQLRRDVMLRAHTSTVQIRTMLERKPPLAIVSPGAVYRRDDDATHSPMFHQIEGLLVDEHVSFADLKGVLTLFGQRLFGPEVPARFRPSYFPFVEPGGEVDYGCVFCRPWEGDEARTLACRVCKGTGWLEILGCGMVHPVVFENVGYDPERWKGFAFGLGMDRIAMLKYGIPNIKLIFDNDIRFLSGF